MNYMNCTTTEKALLDTMNAEEKAVYLATEADLVRLSTVPLTKCGGWFVLQQFIDLSLLMIEMDKKHEQYNQSLDSMVLLPNNTEESQKMYNTINVAIDSMLTLSLAIGDKAMVLDLSHMDSCDIVYIMLGELKVNYFNRLFDDFKLSDLSQHCQGYFLR